MERCLLITIVSVSLFLSVPQAPAEPRGENSCIHCHEFIGGEMGKPVTQWYGSKHQIQGITCDLCHGGSPDLEIGDLKNLSRQEIRTLSKKAMYGEPNFVGAPSGQSQFDLCATCHPESTKTYASSIMGQAYLLKTGGPSCTGCHGAHRNIIPPVPQSCTGCHRDTTGFDRVKAMNITEVQLEELARIRIQLAEEKVTGKRPRFLFERHLESFQTAMVVWGLVTLLLLAAIGLYHVMERRRK